MEIEAGPLRGKLSYVKPGILLLVGPTGAGKSLFMKLNWLLDIASLIHALRGWQAAGEAAALLAQQMRLEDARIARTVTTSVVKATTVLRLAGGDAEYHARLEVVNPKALSADIQQALTAAKQLISWERSIGVQGAEGSLVLLPSEVLRIAVALLNLGLLVSWLSEAAVQLLLLLHAESLLASTAAYARLIAARNTLSLYLSESRQVSVSAAKLLLAAAELIPPYELSTLAHQAMMAEKLRLAGKRSVVKWLYKYLRITGLEESQGEPALSMEAWGRVRLAYAPSGVRSLLSLAAVLGMQPAHLYVEEPEAHLHPEAFIAASALLHEAAASGSLVVVSTHSIDFANTLSALSILGSEGLTKILHCPPPFRKAKVVVAEFRERKGVVEVEAGGTWVQSLEEAYDKLLEVIDKAELVELVAGRGGG